MSMCPVCNGLAKIEITCERCNQVLHDKGKIIDYFDDYSAYLDTDGMKLFDGIRDNFKKQQCPHLCYCSQCHTEKTYLVQEIK